LHLSRLVSQVGKQGLREAPDQAPLGIESAVD
jgi:hypothetical protein